MKEIMAIAVLKKKPITDPKKPNTDPNKDNL
jgi:hypothetical protein